MDVLEAIRKRRSVRRFTGDPVPRGDLEAIVDAGRLATTGSNQQPWDFIVVTDRAMIGELGTTSDWIKKAGAIIPVGVPAEWPTREKRSLEEVIHWERY